MNTEPLISVIIPTHKRPYMLLRAVSSVLNQSYKNTEIIIVDDGSKDCTEIVVKNLQNMKIANIKYLKNETPKGACYARNKGIKSATGEFITGLDDDDEFTYNRLEILLANYDDSYSFITSNFKILTKDGERVIKSDDKISFNDILWRNYIGPQIFIKKERIISLNGFNENLPSAQDYDMWIRLIKEFGSAKKIQKPLYILHTEHDAPRITNSLKKINGYFKVYKLHKNSMTKKQKIYNVLSLQKLKGKDLSIKLLFSLFPSKHFFSLLFNYTIQRLKYKRISN